MKAIKILTFLFLSLCVAACANRGLGPQGGPDDVTPPKIEKSTPNIDAVNFNGKKVVIHFDEIVQIENPFENVIVSPTQKKQPTVKTIGSKVLVEFSDTLQQNTTYTIDFGDALSDFNEKNVLKNFTFSFSTGNQIDTLAFSGIVLDATTLEPVKNCIVGVYSLQEDSLFTTTPLQRITKTNDKGEFMLRNIADGEYHLFALQDLNRTNFFDSPEESISFTSEVIRPSALVEVVDSISEIDSTEFKHLTTDNKVILRQFKEDVYIQYLIKSERKKEEHFTLFFNESVREMPKIEPINFELRQDFIVEASKGKDTITYWIPDSTLINQDTLRLALHYEKTDSSGVLVPALDTLELNFLHKKPIADVKKSTKSSGKKKQQEPEKPKQDFLKITSNASGGKIECYDDLILKFPYPIKNIEKENLHFYLVQNDSVRTLQTFEMKPTDNLLTYMVYNEELDVDKKYAFAIDSAAITDIYGHICNKEEIVFELESFEKYATLILNIPQAKPNSVVQLLSEKEIVQEQKRLDGEQVTFRFLHPGQYRVRMFVDENNNNKLDTGKYKEKRQPEEVFYFNKKLNLRANWEITENWTDFLTTPIDEQKTKLK